MSRTPTIAFEDDDGVEHQLPAKYEVCPHCRGAGSHVNPNIDGNGIAAEDFYGPDWDDESREAYMRGDYDVTCERCAGANVVAVLDREHIAAPILALYDRREQEDAMIEASERTLRAMEAYAAGERD